MKKEKFDRKCQEFIDYETNALAFAKEYLKDYKAPLEKRDLCLDVQLTWWRYIPDPEEVGCSYSRIPFKSGYHAFLIPQVLRKGENPQDLDLVSVWMLIDVTRLIIWGTLTHWNQFKKYSMKHIKKNLDYMKKMIEEVLEKGYDEVLNSKR